MSNKININSSTNTVSIEAATTKIVEVNSPGPKGAQGLQGLQGITGIQGPSDGAQGTQGIQGETGIQGLTGIQGTQGIQGVQGTDGSFGGASFNYTFSTSILPADPGQGLVRLDNPNQDTSALMYIDITDDDGNSIQSFLETIDSVSSAVKGHVRISKRLDSSSFILFSIADLTDNVGWWSINVNSQASSAGSPFINLEDIIVSFVTTGDRGTQGTQGIQGIQGVQGITGVGTQGTQGETGIQGLIGIQGTQGNQGRDGIGTQGTQGLQGVQGFTGLQGVQGLKGTDGVGTQGTQGIQGLLGSQGFAGLRGQDGSQGVQGITGIGTQGAQGFTGLQGIQGFKGTDGVGTQGTQGIQGLLGSQGFAGLRGDSGAQGIQGIQGTQGLQGYIGGQGVTGSQGIQGTTGIQGVQGTQGVQGIEGNFGGATFDYTFDSSTVEADPGTGFVRLDVAQQNLSGEMYIDSEDDNGNNINSFLETIDSVVGAVKGFVRITKKLDATSYLLFAITELAPGDATIPTPWWFIDMAIQASSTSSPFTNNDDVLISFVTTGQKGDTGAQGTQGTQGIVGLTGTVFPYSGSDAQFGTPPQAIITGSLLLSGSGHITASGNISSSGTITATTGSFGLLTGLSPLTIQDVGEIRGFNGAPILFPQQVEFNQDVNILNGSAFLDSDDNPIFSSNDAGQGPLSLITFGGGFNQARTLLIGDQLILGNDPRIHVTASGNISASGNLLVKIEDNSTSTYKTVVYDSASGQLFSTGSYGGSGGSADLAQELTSNQNVGGIDSGDVFNAGSSIEDLLRTMLITYQEPTISGLTVKLSSTVISSADRDVGNSFTCDNSTFNASVDSPNGDFPENSTLQITNADGGTINEAGPVVLSSSNTITYSTILTINRASANGTVTFRVNTESQTTADTQTTTKSFQFKWRNYLLATSVVLDSAVKLQTALDDATVRIQEPFDTNKNWTATASTENNDNTKFTYIVYPSSYGALTNIIQDGALPVLSAFTELTSQQANNNQSSSQTWRIYKSNAPGAFANNTTLAIS